MTINTIKQAEAAALRQKTNVKGTCQKAVRTWFNAPSAGDRDHDGDADAIDGWLSEPAKARHVGDRNPPAGVPLAFRNASHDGYGHRAMAIHGGIRSTDMSGNRYKAEVTSTVTGKTRSDQIAVLEHSMGLVYLGWSETIDGFPIPDFEKAKPPVTPPKPQANGVFTVRVATENLMALPRNKQIAKTLAALNTIAIVGFQEADPIEFKKALKRRYPSIIGIAPEHMDNNTYSSPLHANANRFRRVRVGTRKLYDGVTGISLTRRLTWAILQEKKTAINIGVINLHGPVAKKDAKHAKRLEMRAKAKAALHAQVDMMQKQGLPILITGDFNDTANWLTAKYGNRRVQRVNHGFDQILLVDGTRYKWRIDYWNHVDTPSDHDAVRAQATLVKR